MDDGNFGYRSDVGWRKWTTATLDIGVMLAGMKRI
jgi:hypothetical protein